jgi:hypothetical protein
MRVSRLFLRRSKSPGCESAMQLSKLLTNTAIHWISYLAMPGGWVSLRVQGVLETLAGKSAGKPGTESCIKEN